MMMRQSAAARHLISCKIFLLVADPNTFFFSANKVFNTGRKTIFSLAPSAD